MSELNKMAERFLCNRSRTEFRELVADECRDFDGRLVRSAVYRVVTREQIVNRLGEVIIPLIPVLNPGTWVPGPELLGLEP